MYYPMLHHRLTNAHHAYLQRYSSLEPAFVTSSSDKMRRMLFVIVDAKRAKNFMKTFTNQNRIFAALAAVVVAGFGALQVQAQSVTYTFSDGTSDGWANAGFSGSPASSVSSIGGQNYIFVPFTGFQSANDASDSSGNLAGFNAAMSAAINNPAGYDISYTYYINTATFTGATFLQ